MIGLNPPRGDRASGWICWKDCGKLFLAPGGKKPKSLEGGGRWK